MACATFVSFTVIMGLHPSYSSQVEGSDMIPMSPYLLLLVLDGLIQAIYKAHILNKMQGLWIGRQENVSHILFIDDISIFCLCEYNEGRSIKDIMELLCNEIGISINIIKCTI
jgi:hypothetical protein